MTGLEVLPMQDSLHYVIPFLIFGLFILSTGEAYHWFSKAFPWQTHLSSVAV